MPIDLANGKKVYWQAHQSTGKAVPENTMVSFDYAWRLGGIPEADIRTTEDDVIICLHDATVARTGYDIPQEYMDISVTRVSYNKISEWDVGSKYGRQFKSQRIPALKDVFEAMAGCQERLLYLDIKDVDLKKLGQLLDFCKLGKRVIFSHDNQQNCIRIKQIINDIRTMLWIGGSREAILATFDNALNSGFEGLNQVQLHLNDKKSINSHWRYELDISDIEYCYNKTSEYGIELEVLPYEFTKKEIDLLIDIGIRWFAIDYPEEFVDVFRANG